MEAKLSRKTFRSLHPGVPTLIALVWLSLFYLTVAPSLARADGDVRITSVGDFNLGTWNGVTDMSQTDSLCIFEDDPTDQNYFVTLTGSGAGNAFTLEESGQSFAYEVSFRRSGDSFTSVNSGQRLSFAGRDAASETCSGGGNNAELKITIRASELSTAPASVSSYSGTLTILLEPS